jgi:DNA-binding transcriptional ArsR family regulator
MNDISIHNSPTLEWQTASQVAELFRSFSDTSRVRILSAIIEHELNVSTIAQIVGISDSAVSHHLRSLRQQHLVYSHRLGKEVFYQVIDEHIVTLFRQGVKHILDE